MVTGVGVGKAVQAWSSGSGEGDGVFRRLQRALLDRTRARTWWGAGGCGEPRISSPSPHLLFIALRDGGPLARRTAERPRSGRESGSDSVVGPSRVEINLTLPSHTIYILVDEKYSNKFLV